MSDTAACRDAIRQAFQDFGEVLTAADVVTRVTSRHGAAFAAAQLQSEAAAMTAGEDAPLRDLGGGKLKLAQQPPVPPPSPDDVLYRSENGIAWITLNRPVVLNAVNWSLRKGLMLALQRAVEDSGASVVILTGAGRSFCAGGDVQSAPQPEGEVVPGAMEIYLTIWSMPKPVIAAVRGHAVGQGCELAGVCDFTIASETAQLGEIQIRHGFGPPFLISPFLVGLKQAKELLMLGEVVDAHEARRLGLVNRVVANDRLEAEAEAVARKLTALPQRTVRQNKLLVNRVYEIAGFHNALNYRDDPTIQAAADAAGAETLNEHLRILREQGWDAFRTSRDAQYRQ